MKILNPSQLKKVDAYTIQSEPISSLNLMERAGESCSSWIKHKFSTSEQIAVICGTGNNGGDGLVIARLLLESGYAVDTFVVDTGNSKSTEFIENLKRVPQVHHISSTDLDFGFNVYTLLIDCLFGIGLNRKTEGIAAEVINKMNSSQAPILSIDMPSGLFVEDNSSNAGSIVKANMCLSLQLPKLSLLLPENQEYVGDFCLVPIGLDESYIKQQPTDNIYIDHEYVRPLYLPRTKYAHKGDFGHALLAVGSSGKMGAAVLTVQACARAGAGLVTAYVPKKGEQILQTSIPEAMVLTSAEANILTDAVHVEGRTVGVGPGIGQHPETERFLQYLLRDTSTPMVIDADAINILANNKVWIRYIPDGSILTPHPKELERLIGPWKNDMDKFARVKLFCKNNDVLVVIKGAHTAIVDSVNTIYFNSTGNPGMATGGSGDVLTGIITGLLTQGYSSSHAAIVGVYVHGLAGDLASAEMGHDALLASDIIRHMGNAFKSLSHNE
ncbi:MAG: NAD(P)H-hydrate dehydratase [Bacteroidetes bacterium]|jgi:NAD(P)H-hydrate epimerase|nr:NAD(P)H-hydrate dehydratase [Bacteroidota bacterium]